jgi:hypothetical protein
MSSPQVEIGNMQSVNYKTHWSYGGQGVKRKALLADFILDILYLMEIKGVIPPLHILNEVLLKGGNTGGMGPGTSWRPFSISENEYKELVEALLQLEVSEAKKIHPYIRFEKVTVDQDLHQKTTYLEWLEAITAKYSTF